MSKNTSVVLGLHYETFVRGQIEDGRFGNVSEVIRAGLRLLEEREEKRKALLKAIEEGLASPVVAEFDVEDFYQKTLQKKQNGSLSHEGKGAE